MKKKRIPAGYLKIIKDAITLQVAFGRLGPVPNGRGDKSGNQFYKRVGDWAYQEYGHRPGQGTIYDAVHRFIGSTANKRQSPPTHIRHPRASVPTNPSPNASAIECCTCPRTSND